MLKFRAFSVAGGFAAHKATERGIYHRFDTEAVIGLFGVRRTTMGEAVEAARLATNVMMVNSLHLPPKTGYGSFA